MKSTPTPLSGVMVIEPNVFSDTRGFFLETFRSNSYQVLLADAPVFVQDNLSHSQQGVIRGLHCQTRKPQGKLVRAVHGAVFDVAVDADPHSPTFKQWFGIELDTRTQRQLYVPPGYLHGFQVLSNEATVEYKCTDYYDPGGESGVRWDDPLLAIDWPLKEVLVSAKDAELPTLGDFLDQAPVQPRESTE